MYSAKQTPRPMWRIRKSTHKRPKHDPMANPKINLFEEEMREPNVLDEKYLHVSA
jgi:hypothetical protein